MASHDDGPAGGLQAMLATARQLRRQTGVLRGLRLLADANQKNGFDCPGCAWPDPEARSVAEFCENGAKAILDEGTRARADTGFFARHPLNELRACSERWLGEQGRLTSPMIWRKGDEFFQPIGVEPALKLISDELCSLTSADQAAFYTSGRASNEAAFAFQLLARRLGTNNLPDCSNLCHESSGVALKESLGIGKATVRLRDFDEADLIFVIGQNPGTNHPRMLSTLREARRRGAVIISINPLIEAGLRRFAHPQSPVDLIEGGEPLASRFVRVSVGGDQALFRGLCKVLLEEPPQPGRRSGVDEDFLAERTAGFEAFRQAVHTTAWTEIEELSGVAISEIRELSQLAREAKGIICTWAMGVTQHSHAVATIGEIVNFLLLGGHVGRPGSGACPVRGHSNVQGDRTVGIATQLEEAQAQRLEAELGFSVPRARGLDSVGTIEALRDGRVTHFVSLGGNFKSACPDTDLVVSGLSRTRLNVQIATKLNHSHLYGGGTILLLPCLGRTEQDLLGKEAQVVSVEDTMGVVHASKGRARPPSPDCWSEPRLVSTLGALVEAGLSQPSSRAQASRESRIPWKKMAERHSNIRTVIERVVPGFDSFETRLAAPDGFELPNGPREGRFSTASGRAQFCFSPLSRLAPRAGELILTSVRSHDQFNTTVYSDDDRYRGVFGNRRVLLMNPAELRERSLERGCAVWVESRHEDDQGREHRRRLSGFSVLPYDVPEGAAVGYFPEVNPLYFSLSLADGSRTPTSKAVRIAVGREQ